MASRSLEDLHPYARGSVAEWLEAWEEEQPGIELLITCTYRSPEEQACLYRRNRTRSQIAWAVRRLRAQRLHHLAEILENAPPQPGPPPRKPVTKAVPGTSFHQRFRVGGEEGALAVDFVPIVDGKAAWERADLIEKAGLLGEACRMTWSGRWGWETVHLQYDDGGQWTGWELLKESQNF
jgi:peptidoglycan L-alanyl-D-glutamate endopeptidase CwlK